jgi:hypothetical protein
MSLRVRPDLTFRGSVRPWVIGGGLEEEDDEDMMINLLRLSLR